MYKRQVISKTIPLSSFFIAVNSIFSVSTHMNSFASIFNEFVEHSLYIDDLRYFMEYEPKISLNLNGLNINKNIKNIEFRNVSFRYESQKESCLKNISFRIEENEKIEIVGHNGAGKSTLVKLLMRLYAVSYTQLDVYKRQDQ